MVMKTRSLVVLRIPLLYIKADFCQAWASFKKKANSFCERNYVFTQNSAIVDVTNQTDFYSY